DDIFYLANARKWAHHARRSYRGGLDDENAPAASCLSRDRRTRVRAAGDVREGHRADPSEVVSGLPPPRADGADVDADVPGRPALGAIDQTARDRAHDAAVGHRFARRPPELQERPDAAAG